jgi:hypothetical protein
VSLKVVPQQRKKRKNYATNWKNLRKVDGTFKVSKRNKYNARGRWIQDIWFPSRAEGDRYVQLLEMREAGTISELELHPKFPCYVNGKLVCTYLADFRYRIRPGKLGSRVLIEDVKGMVTDAYRLKRALVQALYPIEIIELRVPKYGGVERCRYLTGDQLASRTKEEAWMTGSSAGLLRSRGASQS